MKTLLILALSSIFLFSCTENERAKNMGGTMKVDVPQGHKFVNATWKDTQLWYVYRPMREGETAEKFSFEEKSNFGLIEGKIIFQESK